MSVENIGKGYVKICVSEEELKESIASVGNKRERERQTAGAF